MKVHEETVWRCPRNHVVTNGNGDSEPWGRRHPASPHGLLFKTEAAANAAIEEWVRLLAGQVPETMGIGGVVVFLWERDIRRYLPGVLRPGQQIGGTFKIGHRYFDSWETRVEVESVRWDDDLTSPNSGLRVFGRVWYRLRRPGKVEATLPDGSTRWLDADEPTPVTDWLPLRGTAAERCDASLTPSLSMSYAVRAVPHVLRWGDR